MVDAALLCARTPPTERGSSKTSKRQGVRNISGQLREIGEDSTRVIALAQVAEIARA